MISPTRLRLFALLFAISSFVANAPAWAAPQTLTINPAETNIAFVLGATLHSAKGSIRFTKGTIQFDDETGTASGELVIDATSATTQQESRDKNMHADVLESARFPVIVFRPDRIDVKRRAADSADVELHGILDMHGQQHPLILPAQLVAHGKHLMIETKFRVQYVDWAMRDYSNFILRVDPFVDVTVQGAGQLGTP
jgi:polyisoprenoid-binding protein YceI